mgnify:CR=1 FL=1
MPHKLLIENIKFLKKVTHLTGKEWCYKIQINYNIFRSWLNSRSEPSITDITKISNAMKVSMDWMCKENLSEIPKDEIHENYFYIQNRLTNGK